MQLQVRATKQFASYPETLSASDWHRLLYRAVGTLCVLLPSPPYCCCRYILKKITIMVAHDKHNTTDSYVDAVWYYCDTLWRHKPRRHALCLNEPSTEVLVCTVCANDDMMRTCPIKQRSHIRQLAGVFLGVVEVGRLLRQWQQLPPRS